MNASGSPRRLHDVGEFNLLSSVLFPAIGRHMPASDVGDDCGFVEVGNALLAVSADAGPRPLIFELHGHERDFRAAGWHAAVATASDIATAGATPLFLVDAVEAPRDLEIDAFTEFMDGFLSACAEFGFGCVGGDVREAAELRMTVFGVGVVEHGARVGRSGMRVGDHLVLLGKAGAFIASYLAALRTGHLEPDSTDSNNLRFPRVQLDPMAELCKAGLITAASDSSDGVMGALENLVVASNRRIQLELDRSMISAATLREAEAAALDPWNLFFFWGDWSVVACVPDDRWERFEALSDSRGFEHIELGRVIPGKVDILATVDGSLAKVNPVRNESFRGTSFNAGIPEHVERMLTASLFSPVAS
jgi:thiamine-monophosphate kinase